MEDKLIEILKKIGIGNPLSQSKIRERQLNRLEEISKREKEEEEARKERREKNKKKRKLHAHYDEDDWSY